MKLAIIIILPWRRYAFRRQWVNTRQSTGPTRQISTSSTIALKRRLQAMIRPWSWTPATLTCGTTREKRSPTWAVSRMLLPALTRRLQINSSDAGALNLKGTALSQGLNRNDEAIAIFDQALQQDPSNFDAWIGKGMALANSGDFSGSLSCFETATQIEPLNPSGWNNRGVVLREMGRYQDALTSFNKALLLDPSYEVAQLNRDNTLQDINQNAQARSSPSQSTQDML